MGAERLWFYLRLYPYCVVRSIQAKMSYKSDFILGVTASILMQSLGFVFVWAIFHGIPEIGLYWEKAAYEEAEHAAKFAELLGEVVTDSTKKNLEMRVDAECGATAGKMTIAKKAKELGLDAIHDTVHEMARDEARHGKAFKGLLERYFG